MESMFTKGFCGRVHVLVATGVVAVMSFGPTAHAGVVAQWLMDNPTPLADSVGGNDLVDPGGSASPTHLATGGHDGGGAYSFDGSDDFFDLTTSPTSLGALNADWTVNFWIKTADNGSGFLTKVPVLGDPSGASAGFAIGINDGLATFRHYDSGWQIEQGVTDVADDEWHMVTFVHHGTGTLDIYVDGSPDATGLDAHDGSGAFPYDVHTIGSTYNSLFAAMSLDDLSFFDEALDAGEVAALVPEPSSLLLATMGMIVLAPRRRSNRKA